MRSVPSNTLALLQARQGLKVRIFVWLTARNRSTGAAQTMGLWTGADNETFTVEGESRLYYGAGNLLDIPPLEVAVGLDVRMYRIGLTTLSPEVAQLIRGWDPKGAPVQIHRGIFDPATGVLADPPHRVLEGTVDEVEWTNAERGGTSSCKLVIATSARDLTRALPDTWADEYQRRNAGDRFLRYADAKGKVWWGSKQGGED